MEERILSLLEGLTAKMDGLSAQVERLESRLDTLAAQIGQRIDALEQTLIGEFHSVWIGTTSSAGSASSNWTCRC